MYRLLLIIFLFISCPYTLFAQSTIIVSGFITDAESGETLIGATVSDTISKHYSIANNNGFYSLGAIAGRQVLKISYVGYSPRVLTFNLVKDTILTIQLTNNLNLQEITIVADNPNKIQSAGEPGIKKIPLKTIKNLPSIMGEHDIMKIAQILPGVQSGSEANTGLYVRGGEGDQNLIMLDGVEVFNPNHLFGFFSIFNDDAFKSSKLYTSGFPAQYNGRLSSVLDIRTKDGDSHRTHVNGSIGLISSKLQVQGPIVDDKLTYIVSYRRTYLDVLAKPIVNRFTDYNDAGYYFQDMNAHLRWNVNRQNTITLSQYFSSDHGYFKKSNSTGINPPDTFDIFSNSTNLRTVDWSNNMMVAQWESALSKKVFLNVSVSFSKYKYNGSDKNNDILKYWQDDSLLQFDNNYSLNTKSNVTNYSASANFDYFFLHNHQISYGGGYKLYQLNPQVANFSSESFSTDSTQQNTSSEQFTCKNYFFYLQDKITLFHKLILTLGVHYTMFQCNGPTQSKLLKRLALNYNVSKNISIHASYSEMEQYLHLLSLARINLASDLWIPTNGNMKPAESTDISSGICYTAGSYSLGCDLYHRAFNNLLSYKEGVSFQQNTTTISNLTTTGKGQSAGIELYIEKNRGRFTGMASYTYSRSVRQFEEINEGREFFAQYDRPHNFRAIASLSLNKNWSLSTIWTIMSGSLQTMAVKNYIFWSNCIDENTSAFGNSGRDDILLYKKNSLRLPTYHRLDIAAKYTKKYKHFTGILNFGVYNAYNAKNAYEMQVKTIITPIEVRRVLEKKVLFPILPFISYSFEF